MPFEHRSQDLLPPRDYVRRVLGYTSLALGLVAGSLLIGMVGYHVFGRLPWVDSFLNASMILAGMGPVDPMPAASAKIFAGCYALFSGVTFIGSMGVVLTPVVHRFLHRFHLELEEGDEAHLS